MHIANTVRGKPLEWILRHRDYPVFNETGLEKQIINILDLPRGCLRSLLDTHRHFNRCLDSVNLNILLSNVDAVSLLQLEFRLQLRVYVKYVKYAQR